MIRSSLLLSLLVLTFLSGCGRPEAIQESPAILQRAESFMAQGVKKYERFQYPAARTKFVLALHEYQSFNDKKGIVRSRLNLARVALNLGEFEEAENELLLARKIINEQQLTLFAQYVDIITSSLLIRQNKYDEAEYLLSPYLNSKEDIITSNTVSAAIIQNRTLIAFGTEKETRQWLVNYREAVRHELEKYQPRLLRFEAALAKQEQNLQKAVELLGKALELYSQQSDPRGIAYTSLEKAAIQDNASLYTAAIEDYERGLSAGFRIRDRYVVVTALEGLIRVYGKSGNNDEQRNLTKLLGDILAADSRKPWYLLRPID